MLKLISKMLCKDETTFKVDMTCGLESKSELLHGGKITMHTTGTLKEIRQAIKHVKEGAKSSKAMVKN